MTISKCYFRWLYLSLGIFSMSLAHLVADDFDSIETDYNEEINIADPEEPPADRIRDVDGCGEEGSNVKNDPHHPPRFMTDHSGSHVKLNDRYLFIAAPSAGSLTSTDAIYVYYLNDQDQWILTQTIDKSNLVDLEGGLFGLNVEVDLKGGWLLLTGVKKSMDNSVKGSVTHVFKLNRTNGMWNLSQTLINP